MVSIEAVYFVPQRRAARNAQLAIFRAMYACQKFYMEECRFLLNWRLRAAPIIGRKDATAYEEYDTLVAELLRVGSGRTPIAGVFFEGPLRNGAFAWNGDRDPQVFVIAEPYLTQVLRGDRIEVVAHEIGHTLGLDDHSVGTSIMSSGCNCDGLDRRALRPWRRAHLNHWEIDRIQSLWGWNGLRRTHTARSIRG